jgi:hypothetical protein
MVPWISDLGAAYRGIASSKHRFLCPNRLCSCRLLCRLKRLFEPQFFRLFIKPCYFRLFATCILFEPCYFRLLVSCQVSGGERVANGKMSACQHATHRGGTIDPTP